MINLQENIFAHEVIKKIWVFLNQLHVDEPTDLQIYVLHVKNRLNVNKMLEYKRHALSHCFDINHCTDFKWFKVLV